MWAGLSFVSVMLRPRAAQNYSPGHIVSVSYTHLDVYKRQVLLFMCITSVLLNYIV